MNKDRWISVGAGCGVVAFGCLLYFMRGCPPTALGQPELAAQEYTVETQCRDVFADGQSVDLSPAYDVITLASDHASAPECNRWLPVVDPKNCPIGKQLLSWFAVGDVETCVSVTLYDDWEKPSRVCMGTY